MIRVRDLKKTYSPGTASAQEVLHGVSFDLPDRGFICILGRSGSGKTSLLNAVGGLDSFDSGTVETDGITINHSMTGEMERQRSASFAYVFQNYYLLCEHSVAYNVYLGLNSLELSEKEKLRRVCDALEKVDMLRFAKRLTGELSGGQQQRVAIARAIAKDPKVIFADEPTGNLDEESTLNICSLLKKLSKKSLVVMVTHEERLADFFADRIITIEDGVIGSDETDWVRGSLISADRDRIYAKDMKDQSFAMDPVRVRVLSDEKAAPADITIVVEDGKLIIKTDDPRLVLCSKSTEAPFISEESRPRLESTDLSDEEGPEEASLRTAVNTRRGLGLKMLLSELKTSASRKKLRSFATGLFLVLLSVTLFLAVYDMEAAAKVDPKDFITADSHVLELKFDKGPLMDDKYVWTLNDYEGMLIDSLEEKGLDIDCIPDTSSVFSFVSSDVPQYGVVSMSLGKYNLVKLSRFNEDTLISGRMPQRYDEIIVDKWVLEKCTSSDGIAQNLIPNIEYMIGKRLNIGDKNYRATIVGICDSGEPSIYIKEEALLSVGIYGFDAISYSEFVSITGNSDLAPLASGESAVIADNVGSYYLSKVGQTISLQNGAQFLIREAVKDLAGEYRISAIMVISDEDVPLMLRHAIQSVRHFKLWCADKDAVLSALSEPLGEELEGKMKIDIIDTYGSEYSSYMARRSVRLQTRFIISVSAAVLCLVMLYIIQRVRVRDRLDLISVYRLLGVPGRDAVAVFIAENLMLTVRFALPSVLVVWAGAVLFPALSGAAPANIPFYVPLIAFGVIAAAEVIVAVLPVLRLLAIPPARLAAKYDF